MTITYAPRVPVHPDRYGADRATQLPMVKWLILHTSEQSGIEDPDDAEDLAAYMTTPGDRPSTSRPGEFYGASYHGVTDTDRVIPCTEDTRVAYAAGGANRYGLHLCIPVRIRPRTSSDTAANQTRAQWLDAGSRPYIRQTAEWIVDKAGRYGIPLRRITPAQMRAGSWGYCDHHTASLAFAKSDHTDVGDAFPWDVLEADITAVLAEQITPAPDPSEEDPMEFIKVHDQATNHTDSATYLRHGFTARWVRSGADKKDQAAQLGVPLQWRQIQRSELAQLTLIGPQPQGDGVITSIDDFARSA